MYTAGSFIRRIRLQSNYSLVRLSDETKIKVDFIVAIERENWKKLPEYPVVVGFVKKIARTLEADEQKAIALLRRDYPPEKLSINPKPDVENKFFWGPRLTFIAGISLVILLIGGYLGYQYLQFISPPKLEVSVPQEGAKIEKNEVKVLGVTDSDATIKVNNQPVLIDEDGKFSTEIEITESTREIVIEAFSRSGRESAIVRSIEPMFE